jgi:thioredoxin-related protein
MRPGSFIFYIIILTMFPLLVYPQEWYSDLDEGLQTASAEDRPLLLVFSGSDWCAPCIRLKSEVLGSHEFMDYASKELVLVNIDFPRKKKNMPPPEVAEANAFVAEKYNPNGDFPKVLLFSPDGSRTTAIDHSGNDPTGFVNRIKSKRKELYK